MGHPTLVAAINEVIGTMRRKCSLLEFRSPRFFGLYCYESAFPPGFSALVLRYQLHDNSEDYCEAKQ